MNREELESQMTDEQRASRARSLAALDAQVSAVTSRRSVQREPKPGPVANGASILPEIEAKMMRARDSWRAFCESCRPQFDAAPETKGCEHHPIVQRLKLFEESCQESSHAREYRTIYAPCPECRSEESKARQRAFWRRRGVPERVLDSRLDNFQTDTEPKAQAAAKVREWLKRGGNFLILRGSCGTGKSHLASACLKFQENGLWITHADLLADLRTSYNLHSTEALLDTWRGAEMLALDEFGLSSGGKDEEPVLYQIFADRYDKRRPTVITTNLDREQFRTAIGYRLIDRIGEDCEVVVCEWESYRTKK